MSGPARRWRSLGLVVARELTDAARSRWAAVVLLLYVGAAVLSMNGALSLLQRIERELASAMQIAGPTVPGEVTNVLWSSPVFRRMVTQAAGSSSLAAELVGVSPIVLLYAGLVFLYAPLLAVLVAAPRLAEDVACGSARFALCRTSRGGWSAGKALGVAGLVGLGLLMGGAGAWIVVRFRMPGAGAWKTGVGIGIESFRAWLYTLPFLGLALGVSHLCRSPSRAIGGALAALFGLGVLAWSAQAVGVDGTWGRILTALVSCTPQAYQRDLWSRSLSRALPAALALAGLAAAYLLAGFAVFRRRDV